MPPKRKAAAKKEPAKKAAKTDAEPSGDPAPSASDKPAASPKKGKPLGSMSATEVWGLSEYVQSGKMTQEGFAALLQGIGIELMTFEAIYFQYRLAPTPDSVEDPHTVCSSKHALQSCLDGLGARKLEDVPEKLKRKKAELEKRQSLEENAAKQKQLEEARRPGPFFAPRCCASPRTRLTPRVNSGSHSIGCGRGT